MTAVRGRAPLAICARFGLIARLCIHARGLAGVHSGAGHGAEAKVPGVAFSRSRGRNLHGHLLSNPSFKIHGPSQVGFVLLFLQTDASAYRSFWTRKLRQERVPK